MLSAHPLRSGVLVLPTVLVEAFASILSGLLIHRTGRYRELIWAGFTILTIGNGLFIHLGTDPSITEIVIFQIVAGAGAGLLFVPPLIALQALVSQDETATATGTLGFIRNLSTATSIIIGGVVFQNGMSIQAKNLRTAGLSPELLTAFSEHAAAANVMMVETITDPHQMAVVKQAFAWSLRNIWIMYTCISFFGIVAGVFIVRQTLSQEHEETITGIKKKQPVTANSTAEMSNREEDNRREVS